jgi:hypothetical protein
MGTDRLQENKMSVVNREPGTRSYPDVFGRISYSTNVTTDELSSSHSSRGSSSPVSNSAPAGPLAAMRGLLIATALVLPIWGAIYLIFS